jgi:hypothetical protein
MYTQNQICTLILEHELTQIHTKKHTHTYTYAQAYTHAHTYTHTPGVDDTSNGKAARLGTPMGAPTFDRAVTPGLNGGDPPTSGGLKHKLVKRLNLRFKVSVTKRIGAPAFSHLGSDAVGNGL